MTYAPLAPRNCRRSVREPSLRPDLYPCLSTTMTPTMTGKRTQSKPDAYWDAAGERAYAQGMYRSSDVESHVRGRLWKIAIEFANELGVAADGHVLDVGCGDGAFANQMLAGRYRAVDGIDKSEAAIRRAQAEARANATDR